MQKVLSHLIIIVVLSVSLTAQVLQPIVADIPMRDNKTLKADVYLPDTSSSVKFPVILVQTPYNRLFYRLKLPLGFQTNIASSPYVFVIVDWRGFYGSSSALVSNPNRGQDGYDIIDWIKNQPWSNGKIGTWGPSALGRVQFMTAKEKHPNHVCAVPLVAAPQYSYQEYFYGGVYRTEFVEQLDNLGFGMSQTLLANPYYNNLWTYSETSTFYPDEIEIPMLLIGGWFDHNIQVMLDFFKGLQQSAPLSVREQQKFLIGPWAHGGFGTAQVGTGQQGELFFPEAANWSDSLALRFFSYYLLDADIPWLNEPDIHYFIPGENNWYSTEQWQPDVLPQLKLFLHQDGMLNDIQPIENSDFLSFNYDPHNPSPTVGGMTLRNDMLQGPYDQSQLVESRNDIAIFTTPVLSQKVLVQGSIEVTLSISSDRFDTDFAVRLTDVYPDGRSILIRDGIRRARFRSGYTKNDETFMQTDSIYTIRVGLYDLAYSFMPGHRIRVDITSSNYPRFDNNLNNGGDMYVAGDTLTASNRLYCNSVHSSYIVLHSQGYPSSSENFAELQEKILVFPNPFTDKLNIEIPENKETESQLCLMDSKGTEVYRIKLFEKITALNLPELPSGFYIAEIQTGTVKKYLKIIKQ